MPKIIREGQEEQAVHELLESDFVLESLSRLCFFQVKSDRTEGDPETNLLSVVLGLDSDIHVQIMISENHWARLSFGGGHHKRILNALKILAEAIRADAKDNINGARVG